MPSSDSTGRRLFGSERPLHESRLLLVEDIGVSNGLLNGSGNSRGVIQLGSQELWGRDEG